MDPEDSDSGGMSDGTFFAIAIFLFLGAGFCWYIALHPGGLTDSAFVSDDNKDGKVQNAREVISYFMNKLATGNSED